MDPRLFATVFVSVFMAELGDKTQLATLLFAADDRHSKLTVFLAAAAALVATTAIAVLTGSVVARYLQPRTLSIAAGIGFIAIGVWTLAQARR